MGNLMPYRPVGDVFSQMRKEIDDLARGWFGAPMTAPSLTLGAWPTGEGMFAPLDVHETETEYVIRVDIPGVDEKDVKITCQGDTLTVKGERKSEKTETKGEMRYAERTYGAFLRSIPLPASVKAETVRAKYHQGVLEIHAPKSEKNPAREIKVEAG